MSRTSITAAGTIHKLIYTLPGVKVLLDDKLVELFSVESRALNEAIKRSIERFPSEFMFQLNDSDIEINRSQFVTTSKTPLTSQNVSFKTGCDQHRKYSPMHLPNSVMQHWI